MKQQHPACHPISEARFQQNTEPSVLPASTEVTDGRMIWIMRAMLVGDDFMLLVIDSRPKTLV